MAFYPDSVKYEPIIKEGKRVLSFDPGALRMGYSALEKRDEPFLIGDGLITIKRGPKEAYQDYKLRVIESWSVRTPQLLQSYQPDVVVAEIVPAMGFNNATQSQLANAAITTVLSISYLLGYPVTQVSARTVQSKIGAPDKGQKVTKVRVRNGVIRLMPGLQSRIQEWVKVFEVPDAIAVGLTHLGYSNQT